MQRGDDGEGKPKDTEADGDDEIEPLELGILQHDRQHQGDGRQHRSPQANGSATPCAGAAPPVAGDRRRAGR